TKCGTRSAERGVRNAKRGTVRSAAWGTVRSEGFGMESTLSGRPELSEFGNLQLLTFNFQPATCNLQPSEATYNPTTSSMRKLLVKMAQAMLRLLPAYPSDEYKPIDQITPETALRRTKEEIEDERATGFLRFFEELELPSAALALDLGCGFGGRTIE